jgi:hypothetical protein
MNSAARRRTLLLALAAILLATGAGTSSASAEDEEVGCNFFALTPDCAKQLADGVSRVPQHLVLPADSDGTPTCYGGTTISTRGGGLVPFFNPVSGRGHNQLICDHVNTNLSVNVTLTADNGTVVIPVGGTNSISVPGGTHAVRYGAWACAAYVYCGTSTEEAEVRGVSPYFSATGIGQAVNPTLGPFVTSAFKAG